MPEITATSGVDICSKIPEIVSWEEKNAPERLDLLVCCAGFEDRATAVAGDLAKTKISHCLVITYPTNTGDNAPAISKFQSIDQWQHQRQLTYDRSRFLSDLREKLSEWRDCEPFTIAIDLSGMSSYIAYRTLTAIWQELPNARLAIYYAEAQEYAPTREEWKTFYSSVQDPNDNLAIAESYEEHHFQTRGIDDTYESDVFPGANVGPLATRLVAFPSFSLQRMKSMIAFAETNYNVRPNNIEWFIGQPPDGVRNGWRFDAIRSLFNVGGTGTPVSTLDYRDTLLRLDGIWERFYTERHLVLAPLGSKMQHLGSFLFLCMHPECGLLLCEPKEFIANKYSNGVGPRWWLDFGQIKQLQQLLDNRCELTFHWSRD